MKFIAFIFCLTLITISCSQSDFDCPDLGLNIGDACELTFPDRPDVFIAHIIEDCTCALELDDAIIDCPDLGSYVGGPCRFIDASGATVEGTTTADCECE